MDHSSMEMDGTDMTSEAAVDSSFCNPYMAMTMYMDGFRWSLTGDGGCINLFFASWTLDTRGKFVGAMFGVILLGICTEGISRLRRALANRARKSATEEHLRYTLQQTGLHGLHALSGYMLMLVTMTFSGELFFSVIVGLMIGFYCFGDPTLNSSNPCCAFLEDTSESPTNAGAVGDRAVAPVMPTHPGVCCGEESSFNGGTISEDQTTNSTNGHADVA